MEISNDFADLLRALNEEDAKYLIVGALAVSYHSQPRATADFDLWVEPTAQNAPRVYRALARFGAPLDRLAVEELLSDDLIFQIGVVPLRIDVLTDISGVAFADAWARRVEDVIAGVKAYVIGFDDLVASKIASARDKDLIDVRRLKQMRH